MLYTLHPACHNSQISLAVSLTVPRSTATMFINNNPTWCVTMAPSGESGNWGVGRLRPHLLDDDRLNVWAAVVAATLGLHSKKVVSLIP